MVVRFNEKQLNSEKMILMCRCGHGHSRHRSLDVDDICLDCECRKYNDIGWSEESENGVIEKDDKVSDTRKASRLGSPSGLEIESVAEESPSQNNNNPSENFSEQKTIEEMFNEYSRRYPGDTKINPTKLIEMIIFIKEKEILRVFDNMVRNKDSGEVIDNCEKFRDWLKKVEVDKNGE